MNMQIIIYSVSALVIAASLSIIFYLLGRGKPHDKPIESTKIDDSLKELEKQHIISASKKPSKSSRKVSTNHPLTDTARDGFSPLTTNKSISSPYNIWQRIKFWNGKQKSVLINMEMANGHHNIFIVQGEDDGFIYGGKKYIFDDDKKYYLQTHRLFAFDYHENIALPLPRVIPIDMIKKSLEKHGVTEVEYAINPSTLDRFLRAKIAEGIMKGAELDAFFRRFQLFIIITMISSILTLIYLLHWSGAFKNLKLPF